jgi:hydrogenase large subunit
MAQRIVVDPITRIEGHLRIEAQIENGIVTDAFSSGTMVRGIEIILKNRDPRDAWAYTERVCGVCTTVHALASVRSVENALGMTIPPNADLIRNLMFCVQYMQDHVVHFYHLHALDWVDVVSALKADPKATSDLAESLSNWPKSSPGYFSDVQKKIKAFVDSGQLGIFANGYWGHKAMKLPAEVNLLAVVHYLEALEWQKEIVKVHTIFGGKNPHPNYLVGGVPGAINLDENNAINAERLAMVQKLLGDAHQFINQVYIPDLIAIASFYKDDWATIGGGLQNYLAYGDLPEYGYSYSGSDFSHFKFPRGIVMNRNLNELIEVDASDPKQIQEYISHSWYEYEEGDEKGKHPWEGETKLNYTGPKPPYETLSTVDKYSWMKTPRWKGHPMEVGPLARMIVGYAAGKEDIIETVNWGLKALGAPVDALFSTLGRTAARGLETKLVADWALEFYNDLITNIKNGDVRTANTAKWDPKTWEAEAKGVGLTEAPRGALAHWIVIKDKKIDNYQLVVPSTWNASPRDINGNRSAYEEALIGTPIADPDKPLEILRTIHSFDPCIACAVHLYDEKGTYIHQLQTF